MGFRVDKALEAIGLEQQALILKAIENIRAYDDAVGIGEHPDLAEAIEAQVKIIADARDVLSAVEYIKEERSEA